MMHCNGKCYLSKKITEQQQKDHSPVSKTERLDIQPFFLPETFLLENTVAVVSKPRYFINQENTFSSFSTPIFHPPTA
jgi:hypothetical protein